MTRRRKPPEHDGPMTFWGKAIIQTIVVALAVALIVYLFNQFVGDGPPPVGRTAT